MSSSPNQEQIFDFLFIGLAGTTFGIAPHAMHTLAAVSEFAIAMMSFYGSAANVLNKTFGIFLLPRKHK